MLALGHIGLRPYCEATVQHTQNREFNDKFIIRLPEGMREQIKQAAAQEGRSMNAQIVQHLRAIYQPTERQEAAA